MKRTRSKKSRDTVPLISQENRATFLLLSKQVILILNKHVVHTLRYMTMEQKEILYIILGTLTK